MKIKTEKHKGAVQGKKTAKKAKTEVLNKRK